MAEYFVSLVSVAAVSSLAALFAFRPDDRWYRFSVSAVLLYTVILPLVSLFSQLRYTDFESLKPELPAFSDSAYAECGEEAFVLGVRRLVSDKYEIPISDVTVELSGFDAVSMRAEKIKIVLSGEGHSVDFRRVRDYLNKCEIGKCEVVYSLNE